MHRDDLAAWWTKPEHLLLAAFLAILAWAPFPYGSNRLWAELILGLTLGGALLGGELADDRVLHDGGHGHQLLLRLVKLRSLPVWLALVRLAGCQCGNTTTSQPPRKRASSPCKRLSAGPGRRVSLSIESAQRRRRSAA